MQKNDLAAGEYGSRVRINSVPAFILPRRLLDRKSKGGLHPIHHHHCLANETQAKLVWYYNNLRGKPTKKKIISRERGYHGCSVVSGSMTGMRLS